MQARILLIEDDPKLGWVLRDELNEAGYRCTWVERGGEGLDCLQQAPFDLVLLDLMLPDRSGFSVLRALRGRPRIPVIVLSARSDSSDKIEALDLGADDYVTKPFGMGELLARIRARLRARAPTPDPLRLRFGAVRVDLRARSVLVEGQPCHLTPSEFAILTCLVQRRDQTVLREELLSEAMGAEQAGEGVLHSHLSRLRGKLGPSGEAIRTVWGIGYCLDTQAV
ncbi:MAG: response regulator transcription factor [Alphaproteobacteria bacterium]|nr:response regulator transcription factor [Alphaproteobacteria bacterium]